MTKQERLRYKFFIETGELWIDTNDNIEMNYLKWVENKALTIPDFVKSFTTEEVVNELEDCDTLDDAIMFFKENR